MIGQMKFKRKNYADAISFYKKSAALYSKASYMPELMLNTAISMDKTGDKKNKIVKHKISGIKSFRKGGRKLSIYIRSPFLLE